MDREAVGPYRVVRILGRGGMGVVLEAVHQAIGRRVAVKVLHAELASNAEYAQRFLNEACAANSINHSSIVDIYDMGTLPDGTTYLVMELIEGETLGRRRDRRGGTLPVEEAAWIGREIALAMAAAHKEGIVHRDLKPDNVMLTAHADSARGERVKLLDFGIAKLRPGLGMAKSQTVVGTVMGTLWYMSPEQLKNTADVDERADTYSLGAVLYHLLAGQPPFRANSEAELIALNLTQTPASLCTLVPDAPKFLTDLIDRMLLKDPRARPSMLEVATQLGRVASGTYPAQAASKPTPETIVRRRRDVQTNPEAASSGLVSSAPDAAGPLPPPSSSSTMSRAASEIKRWQATSWQRLAVAAAVVSALSLGLWTLRRPASSPPANHSANSGGWAPAPLRPEPGPQATAEVSRGPSSTTPSSTERVATSEHPAQQGAVHSLASRSAERKAEGETTLSTGGAPQRPVSQRVLVSEKCVVDPKHTLSPSQRSAIVSAARMSGLSIVQGQTVRLVREGSHMIVETRNAIFSSKEDFFSGTLKGLLARSQQDLPAEVTLKCPR
jgi:serine/threonine protein kinase